MRVAVFFDGKSFYAGWRAVERPRIRFPALSDWLTTSVGGTRLWGAFYYTALPEGESTEADDALGRYLEMLEAQKGYFVRAFSGKPGRRRCSDCGASLRGRRDGEADTALVADAVRYAATDAFDVLVLVSGDSDLVPAVSAVQALGKQAYVATWGRAGLARRLRLSAFGHVDLLSGLPHFAEQEPRPPGGHDYPTADDALRETARPAGLPLPREAAARIERFVYEVRRAEERFHEGYVGLNYFLTRWKSDELPDDPEERRQVLAGAVEASLVEVYEARDGARAVRVHRA